MGDVAQGPPAGVDRPGFDLTQFLDRHLRPLGELFLGQPCPFAQGPNCPAQGDVLWFSALCHSLRDGTGAEGVATGPSRASASSRSSATGALPDLAVAVGEFPHPALGLGCVGEGEACEESHDAPLLAVATLAKSVCQCHQH
jgi:hypothetical protein